VIRGVLVSKAYVLLLEHETYYPRFGIPKSLPFWKMAPIRGVWRELNGDEVSQ